MKLHAYEKSRKITCVMIKYFRSAVVVQEHGICSFWHGILVICLDKFEQIGYYYIQSLCQPLCRRMLSHPGHRRQAPFLCPKWLHSRSYKKRPPRGWHKRDDARVGAGDSTAACRRPARARGGCASPRACAWAACLRQSKAKKSAVLLQALLCLALLSAFRILRMN